MASYPATQYKFETPPGWRYTADKTGFMKSQTIKSAVNGATLSIKLLSIPTNGQPAQRDGALLAAGLRKGSEALAKAGDYRQLSLALADVKTYPAAQLEYTLKTQSGEAFSRVMDFDNGQGVYRLHGAIFPFTNSIKARAEFDDAWAWVLTTLTPE